MNLAISLEGHARNRPRHPAIIDGERVLTYAELSRLVLGAAARLKTAGVNAGDVAGVALDHSPEHLVVLHALARLGAVILPLEERAPTAERDHLLRSFEARHIIVRRRANLPMGVSPIGCDDICAGAAQAASAAPPPAPGGDSPLVLALSSGTTGMPKAALLSHRQQWHRCMSYTLNHGISALDCYVSVLHPGLNVGRNNCLAQLHVGGTIVMTRAATAADMVGEIERHRVTWTFLVPAHMRRLLPHATGPEPLLRSLRLLLLGTGPLLGEERRAVVERISRGLCVVYGTNDCGRFTQLAPEEALTHADSVGHAMIGVEAEIVDDAHRPLPRGTLGYIRFRGPGFPTEYHRNPEATARSFRDGWFYPGDVGTIDAAGYVYLKGRADDVINCEGLKVRPADVEAALQTHPDVAEAAVVGVPKRGSDEVPVAFVVLRQDVAEADLVAFARERLAPYKVPAQIFKIAALPRNAIGKVDRKALQARVRLRDDAAGPPQ